MKVFLTGATGLIGQALVRAVRKRVWQVSALIRDTLGAPALWLRQQGVAPLAGGATQSPGLSEALRWCDVLLHNGGAYKFGANRAQARRMHQVNVQGTVNTPVAVLAAAVPRSFHVSSTTVTD